MRIRHLPTFVLALGVLIFLPDAFAQRNLTPLQRRLLSGFVSHELDMHSASGQTATNFLAPLAIAPQFLSPRSSDPLAYFPAGNDACQERIGTNVKVNQNCLNLTDSGFQGRGQANNETTIAQDPNHPQHLVAGDNDYRRGDGGCGVAYSLDGGAHWQDSTIPIGFTRGASFEIPALGFVPAREYWQASGDPAVAWDTKGNAYFQCMTFQRGPGTTNNIDQSSAVYVFRSTGNNGASWNFPARPAVEQETDFVSSHGTGAPLLDKPYMTVDNHPGSPFQDRVYVTWTLFGADGTVKIYESHSNDYGQTFSAPVLVSTPSPLCPNSIVGTGNCDAGTYSQPFTGSDGALYVVFANFNNPVSPTPVCGSFPCDNHNQILLAKSTDGGSTFGPLVRVANYYDLPDCDTYQGTGQDSFRSCVPEKGASNHSVFRATNYPVGAVHPSSANTVVVTLGSYINVHSKESNGCAPAGVAADGNNTFTGVKTAGACNNDILLSVSTDGGATFTGGTTDPRLLPTINQAPGQDVTDQWWQWAAFTSSGTLAVSYYDRRYGSDETTGFMDMSLSSSSNGVFFRTTRVTSSSMPLPTEFPNGFGNSVFFGDYTGLSAVNSAHPLWMDTRDSDLFLCPGTGTPGVPPTVCTASGSNGTLNDEDIFTANVGFEE